MKNTKLQRIKETLKEVLSQFESERITSDKGILDIQKAGEKFAVGDTVVGINEEGVEEKIESGDYTLTDGTILKVADGKIAEIVVPEVEEVAEQEEKKDEQFAEETAETEVEETVEEETETETETEEEKTEEEVEAEAEETTEEAETEETFESVEDPTNEGEETVTEAVVKLRMEVDELFEMVRILKEKNAELAAAIVKLQNEPAAKPATEEFEMVNKITKTGNEKLDRLARIVNA